MRGKRVDIQGLRAIAVGLVVIYHLWPLRLTGGFIGVDVFFVISGFLITQHLLREVDTAGTISLSRFWARRIRRLLPAAFTVLAAALVMMVVWIPRTVWTQTMQEIAASAFYVENWLLASNSIDYLGAENEPSLVQHFWSLSVEEQFYVVWPLLLVLVLLITKSRRAIPALLVMIFTVSLAFSIYETIRSQPSAYFITPTRMWEFAAGGMLVFAPELVPRSDEAWRRRILVGMGWLGIAAILGSAVVMSGRSPFPGYIALIPVIGTVLAIYAGNVESRFSLASAAQWRPVQSIGDHSYAIYLWHWPLIVAFPFAVGAPLGNVGRIVIIVLSFVLALLTKKFVEDPMRLSSFWIAKRRAAYSFAAAGMAVFLVATTVGSAAISSQQQELDKAAAIAEKCMGASAALNAGEPLCQEFAQTEDRLFPALESRADDTADQYSCYVNPDKGVEYRACTYGVLDSDTRIAITGDSHAASLIPGLLAAAKSNSWAIDVFVGRDCQLTASELCSARAEFDERILEGGYDAVLATGRRSTQPSADALAKAWEPFLEAGVHLIPLVDVPVFAETTESCVSSSAGSATDAEGCVTPVEDALSAQPDQYGPAAAMLGLDAIDLTDTFCTEESCAATIGNVLVYRDLTSHITATFSRSLAPILATEIEANLFDARQR